jgi:hypothetical protein
MTQRTAIPEELKQYRKPSQFRRWLAKSPNLKRDRMAGPVHLYQSQTGDWVGVGENGHDDDLHPAVRSHVIRDIIRAGFLLAFVAVLTYPLWSKLLA